MSSETDNWEEEMRRAADEAAAATDQELEAELAALRAATTANLAALKPQITDQESYDKLIQAVNEATQRNESLAQLTTRIQALGTAVVKVASVAAKLLV